MKIRVVIRRQKDAGSKKYLEEYLLDAAPGDSVIQVLEAVNLQTDDPVVWECSCKQNMCGACAMIINGIPRLACSTFIRDICSVKDPVVRLAPLSKFPVVKDLRVDRSALSDDQKKLRVWLDTAAEEDSLDAALQYLSASCMQCGCCLEVCPNYSVTNAFTGAAGMHAVYRVVTQQEHNALSRQRLRDVSRQGLGHCSRSLSCETVCPMHIPHAVILSKLNRLNLRSFFWK